MPSLSSGTSHTLLFIGVVVLALAIIILISSTLVSYDEMVTIFNYYVNSRRKSRKTTTPNDSPTCMPNFSQHEEYLKPLHNPVFSTDQPYVMKKQKSKKQNTRNFMDNIPLFENDDFNDFELSDEEYSTDVLTETIGEPTYVKIEKLQRLKLKQRKQKIFPKDKVNFFKKMTTKKIIDKIKVIGKRKFKNIQTGKPEYAYFLQCHTKMGYFYSLQTQTSLMELHSKISDKYLIDFPFAQTPKLTLSPRPSRSEESVTIHLPENQIEQYFEKILSYQSIKFDQELIAYLTC